MLAALSRPPPPGSRMNKHLITVSKRERALLKRNIYPSDVNIKKLKSSDYVARQIASGNRYYLAGTSRQAVLTTVPPFTATLRQADA
ncbi:hypothetical protein E2C01_060926 [Portunus trituberculatus]|uniref:Uncharacterized protein n=1 Tax=Portunus trituberculatus TaxID=210409 RepID=A0A5B7H9E8_PORTR|nr:hypothetical protein [Portunus trituberculatus]